MDVKVSVIIPVYNREQYVQECIASLQKQTHQNIEIILIDDGSSDKTVEICRTLAKEDPRILLLAMEHGGVSAARNKGLDTAKGKYIFFLDSDDVIHPLLLETLAEGMEKYAAPLAGTKVLSVPQSRWHTAMEEMQQDAGPGRTAYKSFQEAIREVFAGETPLGMIGGVMMRRDWIGQTRFRTDLYIGEDYYFVYENLIKGASAVFLEQRWYYCRLHADNSSWDYQLSGFMNRLYRRELVWKSEEAFGRTENANYQKREAFAIFMRFLEKNTMDRSQKKQMRKVMRSYGKTVFPALQTKTKILYIAGVYFPPVYWILSWIRKKLK